jgi:hypothetical protein
MKSSLIYSFLLGLLVISGCRKEDNPKVPEFTRVPVPQITLAEGSGNKIPISDPSTYTGTIVVDDYFKHGEAPKQIDVVVIKNGDVLNQKVLQSAVTSFPTNITVTGPQFEELFGEPIADGDEFTIGADLTTQDGIKYVAFSTEGITYAPGIFNMPGSSPELTILGADICLYNAEDYTAGDYEVVLDEWNDYTPGTTIQVTKIDDTHFSFMYAASVNPSPIIIEVDPNTNAATVAPVAYGDYGDGAVWTATSVTGSEVDPCDVSFHLILDQSSPDYGGSVGEYAITFKKKL